MKEQLSFDKQIFEMIKSRCKEFIGKEVELLYPTKNEEYLYWDSCRCFVKGIEAGDCVFIMREDGEEFYLNIEYINPFHIYTQNVICYGFPLSERKEFETIEWNYK